MAASSGDFSQRGDVDRYQYDFRDMIDGLNQLMETTDGNLAEVSELLQAIARGDLTARMEGDFHGVFARGQRVVRTEGAEAERTRPRRDEDRSVGGNVGVGTRQGVDGTNAARGRKPVAKISALTPHKQKREPGRWKGMITMGPEFFEPMSEEELRLWEGESGEFD